MPVYKTVKPFC